MLCRNCGVDLVPGAAFCPSCGRPVGQPSELGSSAAELSPTIGRRLEPNIAGLLCYLFGFVTGIFFLLAEPYDRDHFVRFHAFQSILLSGACMALYIVLGMFLPDRPLPLEGAGRLLYSLLPLALCVLWLALMFKAYHGKKFALPVIGQLAEKEA